MPASAPVGGSDHPTTAPLLPPALTPARPCGVDVGMSVDEMLQRFAGEFGRWQLRQFLLTSLAWVICAFQIMVAVFADREPTRVGQCPPDSRPGMWSRSTVEEWGLDCGPKYKVGLAQSAFFAGSMAGAAIFGHLSDSFLGRKGSLTLSCSLNTAFSFLTAFSPSFTAYAAFRFFSGLSTAGVGLSAFILATEPVGPTFRAAAAMSTFHFFSLGCIALSLTSLLLPHWRPLYAVSSLPSLLFLLLVLPFVYESPRWFLIRNNLTAAMAVLGAIAKSNRCSIPDQASLSLDHQDPAVDSSRPTTIVDVLCSPVTRPRLITAFLINFFISVAYYGLTLNVGNLGTDIHTGAILNAVAEMPAYALSALAMRYQGRRALAVSTMWLCGAFSVAAGMFDRRLYGAERMGCAAAAIFAVAATYNLLYIYTAELFPTAVRNAALGSVTLAGQMGAVAAPVVVAAGGRLPFAVFGGCAVAAAMLGLFLPETRNRPFYETMAGLVGGEGAC